MPQIATSTGAVVAVPQNRERKSIVFTNIDTTNNIYLDNRNIGTITTSNAGIKLRAGDSIGLSDLIDGEAQIQEAWQAIADAGTPTLLWYETEKIRR